MNLVSSLTELAVSSPPVPERQEETWPWLVVSPERHGSCRSRGKSSHLSVLPNLARSNSRQVQRGLNSAFQDLLRLDNVGDRPRELEGAHHETEDGGRATTARCRIGIGK